MACHTISAVNRHNANHLHEQNKNILLDSDA